MPCRVSTVKGQNLCSEHREGLEPLLLCCRAAATAAAADASASALAGDWVVQSPSEAAAMEDWCLDPLSACAPRRNAVAFAPPTDRILERATADALDRLGGAISTLSVGGDRHKPRECATTEKETLLFFGNYGGAAQDVTDDVLPPFWLDFRAERGKQSNCRLFLESRIKDSFNDTEVQCDCLVTSTLINDLKGLDFAGGDSNITCGMRSKGLSFCALAPLGPEQDVASARAEFMAMEASNDRLTAADRMKINRLVATMCADTPSDRTTLACWVGFTTAFSRMLFTNECRAVAPLMELLFTLRQPMPWTGCEDEDFRTLAWRIHAGLRRFFMRRGEVALNRIIADLEGGVRPDRRASPRELLTTGRPSPNPNPGRKRPGGTGGSGLPEGSGKSQRTSYAFSRTPLAETNKGFDALKAARKKVTLKAHASGKDEAHALLGPEFVALCDKDPCLSFFTRGTCNFPNCGLSHKLASEPPDEVVAGILERLQTKTAAIAANPPSLWMGVLAPAPPDFTARPKSSRGSTEPF